MELNLKAMATESRNPNTMNLDTMSPLEVVTITNQEDANVLKAIRLVLPQIARCAELAKQTIQSGGRIIYMGAGTSGRLGVLDAVECPPTFGVPYGTVIGLVASGAAAFDALIANAKFRHIILSYNTDGIMSVGDIESVIKKHGKPGTFRIHYIPYRRFKSRSVATRTEELKELLVYIEKEI